MDELQALDQWSRLYNVSVSAQRGRWHVSIMERQEGTTYIGSDRWDEIRVIGESQHDPMLAIQSALIQARAKWPKVWEGLQQHDN